MNKKTMKIAGWALGLSLAVAGIGAAIGTSAKGAAEMDARTVSASYTISFKTGSGDGTSGSTSTPMSSYTASDYVATNPTTATNASFQGGSGLKLGTKSDAGIFTFDLAEKGRVYATTIVVSARRYNAGYNTNIACNDKTEQSLSNSSSFGDYTFSINDDITSIKLATSGTRKYAWVESITVNYTYEVDDDSPSVAITNANKLAPHGVARPLSAAITNDNGYTITWACENNNVSLSSTTGTNITVTASNAIPAGTLITISATLDDSEHATTSTTFRVSSKDGASVANALSASEAKTLVATGEIEGETLYVKGYANNATDKFVWLSDTQDTTKTFEIYNKNGLPATYADGTYIVGHGLAKKYNASTNEVENGSIDSADYFTLGQTAVEVNNTQSVNVTASSATGDIVWDAIAGTGSVSLSNKSNTGVTITGTSVGTATVTATVGNFTKSISVTVAKYATDWAFKDIVLEADSEFQDTYYVDGTLDTEHLTVTYIEHSDTLGEDREHEIDLGLVTFNFDSSKTGSFNLTATYLEHTTDDAIPVSVIEQPDGIAFNKLNYTTLSNTTLTDTANDSNGVSWTVTTAFSGSVSITKTDAHLQIGSGSKRADSVAIAANMGSVKTFTKLAFTFDAFDGDTGAVSMKLDGTEIATGNIDAKTTVVVEPDSYVRGQSIQIDVENEGNLRVNLISVEYLAYSDDEMVTNFVNDYMHMSHTTNDGSCTSEGWYEAAKTGYGKLFSQQKSLFNSEAKYADAKARLIKWAEANSETFDPSAGTFGAATVFPLSFVSNSMPLVVTVAALGTAAAAGFFIFQRKRKEN